MKPKAYDPLLLRLAELAKVRPPHVHHCLHAIAESRGKFNAAAYAAFSNLDVAHVTRMLDVFEKEGILDTTPREAGPRASRLPADFVMPPEWIMWAQTQRAWTRDVAETEAASFIDYWHAQPGLRGLKTDWEATWRNWVRRSHTPNGEPVKAKADPEVFRQLCKQQIEHFTRTRNDREVRNWRRKLEEAG